MACTLVAITLVLSSPACAQSPVLEVPQLVLNSVVLQMGAFSDSGIYYPPSGAPSNGTDWRWAITGARFNLTAGAMSFTATVSSRVAGQDKADTRTVPVSVGFDATSARVRLSLGAFMAPIQTAGVTITQVNVAKLYGISLPIEAQTLTLPLPGGGTRTVTAKPVAVTSQVLPGRLVLTVQVSF
jgi:hypothetical protein